MANRLQVRHDKTIYTSVEDIIDVINNADKKILYAEPIVFRYGNAYDPNVVLVIGSSNDGGGYTLIDVTTLEKKIDGLKSDGLITSEKINLITSDIETIKALSKKNKNIFTKSDTIEFEISETQDGVFVKPRVKVANGSSNFLKVTGDGLALSGVSEYIDNYVDEIVRHSIDADKQLFEDVTDLKKKIAAQNRDVTTKLSEVTSLAEDNKDEIKTIKNSIKDSVNDLSDDIEKKTETIAFAVDDIGIDVKNIKNDLVKKLNTEDINVTYDNNACLFEITVKDKKFSINTTEFNKSLIDRINNNEVLINENKKLIVGFIESYYTDKIVFDKNITDTSELKKIVDDLKDRLSHLGDDVSNNSAAINISFSDLGDRISIIGNAVDDLGVSVADNQSKIQINENSINDIKAQIESDKNILNKKIDETSKAVNDIKNDVSNTFTSYDDLSKVKSDLSKEIKETVNNIDFSYNTTSKQIILKLENKTLTIDASDFIKDKMIKSVDLYDNHLIFVWNTDNDNDSTAIDLGKFIDTYKVSDMSEGYLKISNRELSLVVDTDGGLASYKALSDLGKQIKEIIENNQNFIELSQKIDSVENDIESINGVIDLHENDINDIKSDITTLNTNHTNISNKLDNTFEKINVLDDRLTTSVTELKTNYTNLDKKVEDAIVSNDNLIHLSEGLINNNITMPNSVGGFQSGITANDITGKTISSILEQLLFPRLQPSQATTPSISGINGFTATPNSSVLVLGSKLVIGSATVGVSNGRFNATYGGQPTPDYSSTTKFVVTKTVGGYYDSGSTYNTTLPEKEITLGSVGKKDITVRGYLNYTAPTNKPKDSYGSDTETGSWTAGEVYKDASITVYSVYPIYTNVSGTTLLDGNYKQLNPFSSDTFEISVPSESKSGIHFEMCYPSSKTITGVKIKDLSGKWVDNSGVYNKNSGSKTMNINGINVEYNIFKTGETLLGDVEYKFIFNNKMYDA